ncbi:hypothetical protein RB598_002352 [Gaeumannomyces tritici]
MFSPAVVDSGHGAAMKSRRRQRPLSSENLMLQPKAKRQRLPLSEQTFQTPDAPPEMYEVKAEKLAKLPVKHERPREITPAPKQDLSVRSKKPKPGERVSKGDGSVVLTTNNAYTVSKLPALPDKIRVNEASSRQHGTLYSATGHALCLTHTQVFVWPYTINTTSPETFVFNLDHPSRHASDPLPLGSLVAPSAASDEPGLIVVMPVSGKISYWESIASAATLTFMRQQRNGIEDSIPGMFSGEHVIQLVSAETAGFILAFSSGRMAHLSVRDSHGRPTISVQFLRSGLAQTTGGFLGSIRHVLKASATKGDIATVRTGPPTKAGERNVVAATSRGKITAWRVQRGGHHDVLSEVDVRDSVIAALRARGSPSADSSPEDFELLDVAFSPNGGEHVLGGFGQTDSAHSLWLLVTYDGGLERSYALVEAAMERYSVKIGALRPLTCYSSSISKDSTVRPRLYLPQPGRVAFIVFDRAVIIASLAARLEAPGLPTNSASFEDVIDLRDQDALEITGSGVEEPNIIGQEVEGLRTHRQKIKNPGTLLMVRGVGVVRVATTDIDRFSGDATPRITPKSKLEQAVFFGIKDDNPLAFDGKRALPFSSKDIGDAALQLSQEILSSESPYLLHVPALLEGNLRTRGSYLDRLMTYLNALKVDLDRETRWALLWNAEKMSVASRIWKQHEQFLSDRATADKKSVVSEIVEYIHEDEKKVPNQNKGELDRVRHWFTHDIWRLELFVAWAYEVIKYMYTRQVANDTAMTRLLYEAMQVQYEALKGAFEYRKGKLSFYGLQDDKLENGVLVTGYEGLPTVPWTSTYYITNNAKRLIELAHKWLKTYYPPQADLAAGQPDPGLIESIRGRLPSLTDKYLTTLLEHSRWAQTRTDQSTLRYGEVCRKTYLDDRYEKAVKLKDYGLWNQAIEVAENHDSIAALAEIMVEEVKNLRQRALDREQPPSRVMHLRERARVRQHEIAESFERYGDEFAFAVYEILLREEGVKAVLDFPGNRKGYATKFLRTKPELSKISWINDVEQEKDISHAAETLIELGLNREQQVWNKKIELSLGKLALLAEGVSVSSDEPARNQLVVARDGRGDRSAAGLRTIDRELAIIKIQDKLYNIILPAVSLAVDEAAELELALEYHAGNMLKKHKALLHVFEDAMARLLRHEALEPLTLIDLLTLVSIKVDPTVPGFDALDDLFFCALRVAHLSLRGEEVKKANRVIWRRCFIRDKWSRINDTQFKDDGAMSRTLSETSLYLTLYACHDYSKLYICGPNTLSFEAKALTRLAEYHGEQKFDPLVTPSEALGVYTESLDNRFDGMDDSLKRKLLDAMNAEDAELSKYIMTSRMDHWYQTAFDESRRMVQEDLDRRTEEGAALANGSARSRGNGSSSSPPPFLNGSG